MRRVTSLCTKLPGPNEVTSHFYSISSARGKGSLKFKTRKWGLVGKIVKIEGLGKPVLSGRSYMSCGQSEQPFGRGLNFCLGSPRA